MAGCGSAFLNHTSWQVDDVDEVGRGAMGCSMDIPSATCCRHPFCPSLLQNSTGHHATPVRLSWRRSRPSGSVGSFDRVVIAEELGE